MENSHAKAGTAAAVISRTAMIDNQNLFISFLPIQNEMEKWPKGPLKA
jgi:hypothetical protein